MDLQTRRRLQDQRDRQQAEYLLLIEATEPSRNPIAKIVAADRVGDALGDLGFEKLNRLVTVLHTELKSGCRDDGAIASFIRSEVLGHIKAGFDQDQIEVKVRELNAAAGDRTDYTVSEAADELRSAA